MESGLVSGKGYSAGGHESAWKVEGSSLCSALWRFFLLLEVQFSQIWLEIKSNWHFCSVYVVFNWVPWKWALGWRWVCRRLFIKASLLKYDLHDKKSICFKAHSSKAFSKFLEFCKHHYSSTSERACSLERLPGAHQQSRLLPTPSPPQLPSGFQLFYSLACSAWLRQIGPHSVCLVSGFFHQLEYFKALCSSTTSCLFTADYYSIACLGVTLFTQLSVGGYLSCFYLGTVVKNVLEDSHIQVSWVYTCEWNF